MVRTNNERTGKNTVKLVLHHLHLGMIGRDAESNQSKWHWQRLQKVHVQTLLEAGLALGGAREQRVGGVEASRTGADYRQSEHCPPRPFSFKKKNAPRPRTFTLSWYSAE